MRISVIKFWLTCHGDEITDKTIYTPYIIYYLYFVLRNMFCKFNFALEKSKESR